jgi:hypothetical protein
VAARILKAATGRPRPRPAACQRYRRSRRSGGWRQPFAKLDGFRVIVLMISSKHVRCSCHAASDLLTVVCRVIGGFLFGRSEDLYRPLHEEIVAGHCYDKRRRASRRAPLLRQSNAEDLAIERLPHRRRLDARFDEQRKSCEEVPLPPRLPVRLKSTDEQRKGSCHVRSIGTYRGIVSTVKRGCADPFLIEPS